MDNGDVKRLEGLITGSTANTEQLIVDFTGSLEQALGGLRQTMRDGFESVTTRLDNQAARMDRQYALLMVNNPWSEKADADLRDRIKRLEDKNDK
jgi:hypothetical protein